MAIETTCSGCGKQLSVGDEHAGKRARCPACGQIYTIPAPDARPPDLPASSTPVTPQSPSSDLLQETTGGTNFGAPASTPNSASTSADEFWMRSTEGAEYGPVDRATLDRWFSEGRVGPGYMIRQSVTGIWQGAEQFKPNVQAVASPFTSNSANPFAATTSSAVQSFQAYPKPDQSGLVLAFGILSWFVCPIFGVVAWVMGSAGLRDIRLGLCNPANKGLMQAGYYLGIVNVIFYLICVGGYFVMVALALVLGAMG